jgi:hypothetical protein
MARLARVVIPGMPHRVTQRGNRRQQTFFNDGDYVRQELEHVDDFHVTEPLGDSGTRRLNSVLTPVFKFGFSAAFVAIGVVCTYEGMRQRPIDWTVLGWAFSWAFILLLAYSCLRLKKVVAHSDRLVISNYITESDIPYNDIEEIKASRGRSAVFLRLRLRIACRFGRTIHFLLPSTLAAIESQPEVQLLRDKCPHLCERSRSWWLGPLYLMRPRTIRQ